MIEDENLEYLLKNKDVLFSESFGGNAGKNCAGLNIRVKDNGKIDYVGNEPITNYSFRICLDDHYNLKINGLYKEVKTKYGIDRNVKIEKPNTNAERILFKTIKLYNNRKK